jgi:hypothetical protein
VDAWAEVTGVGNRDLSESDHSDKLHPERPRVEVA